MYLIGAQDGAIDILYYVIAATDFGKLASLKAIRCSKFLFHRLAKASPVNLFADNRARRLIVIISSNDRERAFAN